MGSGEEAERKERQEEGGPGKARLGKRAHWEGQAEGNGREEMPSCHWIYTTSGQGRRRILCSFGFGYTHYPHSLFSHLCALYSPPLRLSLLLPHLRRMVQMTLVPGHNKHCDCRKIRTLRVNIPFRKTNHHTRPPLGGIAQHGGWVVGVFLNTFG